MKQYAEIHELKFCWLDQENLSCRPFLSHFAVSCWVAISQVQISLSGLIKDHDLLAFLVSPVLVVLLVFSISVFNEFWYIQYKIYWALQKYAWTSGKDKPKNWFNFPGHVLFNDKFLIAYKYFQKCKSRSIWCLCLNEVQTSMFCVCFWHYTKGRIWGKSLKSVSRLILKWKMKHGFLVFGPEIVDWLSVDGVGSGVACIWSANLYWLFHYKNIQ